MFDKDGNEIDLSNSFKIINIYIIPKSIKKCIIPNSVTEIGRKAFCYRTSLKSITIPDSVIKIGDCAFYYCKSLKSITIPNSATEIGRCVFSYCNSLESITLPKRFENEGITFSNCHPDLKINYV